VGAGVIGPAKVGPGGVGAGVIGPAKVGPGGVGAGVIGPAKVGPGGVGAGVIGPDAKTLVVNAKTELATTARTINELDFIAPRLLSEGKLCTKRVTQLWHDLYNKGNFFLIL
jgi:hypothetical protein